MSPVTKQKHALVRNGKAKGRGNEITGEDNFSRCPKQFRAANNGRSTDNVRPDRGLDRSNSGLAGHFDRSFLDINILFSIELSLNAL